MRTIDKAMSLTKRWMTKFERRNPSAKRNPSAIMRVGCELIDRILSKQRKNTSQRHATQKAAQVLYEFVPELRKDGDDEAAIEKLTNSLWATYNKWKQLDLRR